MTAADGEATPAGPPAIATFLAALFAPTVLFVSAANNIVLRNLLDLPYSVGTVARFLAAFAISSSIAVPVFHLAGRVRACAALMRLSLFVGAAVLLASLLTAINGDARRPLALVAAVDAAALGALAYVLFRAKRQVLVRVFAAAAGLLLLSSVLEHVYTLARVRRQARARATTVEERGRAGAIAGQPAAGNVYHLILDAFQSEAFTFLAERDPTLWPAGFTYYPEFTAHYARTNHSVPNMLSGRFYREGESMWAWREEAFTGGLWGALAEAGVGVHLYPHYPPYCTPLATTCRDTISYANSLQPRRSTASARSVIVDLWFLNLLPPSVRRVLNAPFVQDPQVPQGGDEAYGFSVTALFGGVATPAAPTTGAPVPKFTHAGAYSVLNFDRLLADEADRPATGQYVFFHAILPHWPFVVDDTCGYIGESAAPPYDAYMSQARCALVLVRRLVERLRELDRLDDALIVVHADHGGKGGALMLQVAPESWPGPDYGDALVWPDGDRIDSATWGHHLVDVYRRALLLVKYPGAGTVATDPTPVQTIDLAPTIVRHFGGDPSGFPGIAIPDLPAAAARAPVFFASSAIPTAHVPRVFSRFVLEDGVWTFRGNLTTAP